MNVVIIDGRLTRDPDIRQSGDTKIARYTLAVDRRRGQGEQKADFISCVAFGKSADFAEKYFKKGIKIGVQGRLSTGSYTNKDGVKVNTVDVIVDDQEFMESKAASSAPKEEPKHNDAGVEGFLHVPDGIEEELPFV